MDALVTLQKSPTAVTSACIRSQLSLFLSRHWRLGKTNGLRAHAGWGKWSREAIGYWLNSIYPTDQSYSTMHRECLAVITSILLLRRYFEVQRLIIRSDHNALEWILNITKLTGKLARWRLRLSGLESEIVQRGRINRQAADAISQVELNWTHKILLDDDILELVLSLVQHI